MRGTGTARGKVMEWGIEVWEWKKEGKEEDTLGGGGFIRYKCEKGLLCLLVKD